MKLRIISPVSKDIFLRFFFSFCGRKIFFSFSFGNIILEDVYSLRQLYQKSQNCRFLL